MSSPSSRRLKIPSTRPCSPRYSGSAHRPFCAPLSGASAPITGIRSRQGCAQPPFMHRGRCGPFRTGQSPGSCDDGQASPRLPALRRTPCPPEELGQLAGPPGKDSCAAYRRRVRRLSDALASSLCRATRGKRRRDGRRHRVEAGATQPCSRPRGGSRACRRAPMSDRASSGRIATLAAASVQRSGNRARRSTGRCLDSLDCSSDALPTTATSRSAASSSTD